MSAHIIFGAIAFCVAATGVPLFNMFLIMMIGDINDKRKNDDLISYFWLTPPKIMRIFEEYRSLYPDGKNAGYTLAAIISAAVVIFVAVICITLFH